MFSKVSRKLLPWMIFKPQPAFSALRFSNHSAAILEWVDVEIMIADELNSMKQSGNTETA